MAIRIVDKPLVVHAAPLVVHKVVHNPRSGDRHKDTAERRAYRAEWMRKSRAAAKALPS
jgi:hypothetical protein